MTEKQQLMIKIARLFYESGLTQEMIAKRMRLSRPRVSRLMQEAIDTGIVKITIMQEPGNYAEIERQLETKYNLLEALVTDISQPETSESIAHDLGVFAAQYFRRIVLDGDIIGFTWGATLASMVENLEPEKKPNCVVMQMVGGLGEPGDESHATGLVSRAAMVIGGKIRLMPAPGVVDSVQSARLLKSERAISQALDQVHTADIAFVGIGNPNPNSLLMRGESIISWAEMEELIKQGAIGDISLRFYDFDGNLIVSKLDERVIGISLDELRKITRVVGIAGGKEKFHAILGATQGSLINVLITDTKTAQRLLDLELPQTKVPAHSPNLPQEK
jgi:DNA-binding transcriptional regulator LsrR (DeoR family)